jgi:uncharacterized small protein (DUF1192 family)
MAKALMGHLAGPDPRAAYEITALRRRIAELEDQVERLSVALAASELPADVTVGLDDELRALGAPQPAH